MKTKFKAIVFCLFVIASAMLNQACKSNKDKEESEKQSKKKLQNNYTVPIKNTEKNDALRLLKEGNERFYNENSLHNHQNFARIKEITKGQSPIAIIVGCSDSRVPPEIVFDQGLGDVFTIRTAGNVMADYEEGSIEYGVEHLGTSLIVVMGHENCGAIGAFLEHEDDNLPTHIASIIKTIEDEEEEKEVLKSRDNILERAVRANVVHGVKLLRNLDPILSKLYKEGKVNIVGAIYHLKTGKVEFLED